MMRRSALPLWWLTMAAALLLHARPPSGTPPLLRLRAALPTCREEGDEISFGDLQVRGVLASRLLEENFKVATPIQSAAMMPIHRGENAVLHAETGSGKTLAYLLPLLNRLHNSRPARSKRRLGGATACFLASLGRLARVLAALRTQGGPQSRSGGSGSLRCGPEARLRCRCQRWLSTLGQPNSNPNPNPKAGRPNQLLVVVPSRELALQIGSVVEQLWPWHGTRRVCVLSGSVSAATQYAQLQTAVRQREQKCAAPRPPTRARAPPDACHSRRPPLPTPAGGLGLPCGA